MTWMRTALAKAREDRHREDAGFSLMETLVATSIFAIFMSLVMAAIIAMLTSTQKSQSLFDGASAVENAFQRLDHQVRYASSIQAPVSIAVGSVKDWDVEWQSQATSTAPETCTQLKYDAVGHLLEERTWQPLAAPITPTGWQLLANNIVNTTATAQIPFVRNPSTGVYAHQSLNIFLVAQPNGTRTSTSEQSVTQATFTALNSNSSSGNVCLEVAAS